MASDSSQSRWVRSGNTDRVPLVENNFLVSGGSDVQPAFLVLGVFPPPAPGAHVLSRLYRARAGRAADRAVALVVEPVIRHVVLAEVAPDLHFRPGGERIELLQAVHRVELLLGQLGAPGRLLAALAGDPRPLAGERELERLDFADLAAALAQLDAVV